MAWSKETRNECAKKFIKEIVLIKKRIVDANEVTVSRTKSVVL